MLAVTSGKPPARVHLYSYDASSCRESELEGPAAIEKLAPAAGRTLWVDVQGLDDAATLERIGSAFGIHPLALADAVNTPQRPKAETYGEQLVVIVQMARVDAREGTTIEQLTIVVGAGYVVTFQELDFGDVLDPVRARLRTEGSAMRSAGADYLAYAMLDAVIDGYYPVLEAVGERLEGIEEDVVERPTREALRAIHDIKRDLLGVRRNLWPQRDAVASLMRGDAPVVGETTRLHLRDCYDHAVQLIDVLETYRELASSLMDAYLSSVSNRLNEVMKVLTVISTVFMPLSFLASLYGMNFQNMPELRTSWGYPALLGVMAVIAGGMLVFFRRRGWLGSPTAGQRRRKKRLARAGALRR